MSRKIASDESLPADQGRRGADATGGDDRQLTALSAPERLMVTGAWLIATSLVLCVVFLSWQMRITAQAAWTEPTATLPQQIVLPTPVQTAVVELPLFTQNEERASIPRLASLHTIIPNRPRQEVVDYTVSIGDSVFGIASKYNIKPETVLWANYDILKDNPDTLSPGMGLKIPPVDGVLYQWKEGDTFEAVAARFEAKVEDVINWPGNKFDLVEPKAEPGQWVMIPGGHREFQQWIVPVIPRGRAGVSKSVYGPGACEGSYDGLNGSGSFIWPTASHRLSGNDYWSGHLAIDIAAGIGDPVYAADSGVVVFAGWSTGGYGYMVMIDHGASGYTTLYAHLSAVSASCGQSVVQGQYIGATGSTGNSTGSHLHFEVRYLGGFVNPWYVLPPP